MGRKATGKALIADAAFRLFVAHGIKRVTVEEICAAAGVSKMTFYRHFRGKRELVLEVFKNFAKDGLTWFAKMRAEPISTLEKIGKLIDYKMKAAAKIGSVIMHDLLTDDSELREMYAGARDQAVESTLAFIREEQSKGAIRPDIKPEFIIFIMDKFMEWTDDEGIRRLYDDPVEMSRDFNNFFFYGLLNPPREEKP